MQHSSLFLIISSPSGVGKTTLSRLLLQRDQNLSVSVSMTTRKPRAQEKEGRDYFFVNQEDFEQHIRNDYFAEHAAIFGNHYGTPLEHLKKTVAEGTDILFDIDWQGAQRLKKRFPKESVSIFIFPPSMRELRRRLEERAEDDPLALEKRLEGAQKEIGHWCDYDYVIVNHHIEECLSQMHSILIAERLHRKRQWGLETFVQQLADA